MVHRLLILGSGADIGQEEIDVAVGDLPSSSNQDSEAIDLPLKAAREQFEREYLEHQIRALGGNISRVATKNRHGTHPPISQAQSARHRSEANREEFSRPR